MIRSNSFSLCGLHSLPLFLTLQAMDSKVTIVKVSQIAVKWQFNLKF